MCLGVQPLVKVGSVTNDIGSRQSALFCNKTKIAPEKAGSEWARVASEPILPTGTHATMGQRINRYKSSRKRKQGTHEGKAG